MPYPNFTAADFTPSSNDGYLNVGFGLTTGDSMNVLPDKTTIINGGGTVPNGNAGIATVSHSVGETFLSLPERLSEIYNNHPDALIKDNQLGTTGINPKLRGNSQHLSGYWTAALTLASWFNHQRLGKQGPGSTYANPLDVPFTAAQKSNFIGNLGCSPDPGMLKAEYDDVARWDPAINNTFYNLGKGSNAFSWDSNGNLTLRDTYVFEGFGDFGVAGDWNTFDNIPNAVVGLARAIVVVVGVAGPATNIAIQRQIAKTLLNMAGADLGDDNRPYRIHKDFVLNQHFGINPHVGNVADMHIKTTWSAQEIATHNPCLFAAALRLGLIPENQLTLVKAEKAMGGNSVALPGFTDNAPVNGNIDPLDVIGSPPAISFGGAPTYPKPFTSYLQNVDDANFYLGPYAKVGSIPGRLVVITDSPGFGEVGFWIQRWDVHNDGPVIAANGYQTKNEWFNTCGKTLLPIRFLHLPDRPLVATLVAIHGYSFTSPPNTVYQTTIGLNTVSNGSQTLSGLISSGIGTSLTLL